MGDLDRENVTPLFRDNVGNCEGRQERCAADDCPIYGTFQGKRWRDGRRRVKGCGDPVAVGSRSNRRGHRRQNDVARAFGIPARYDEETLGGPVRLEVKSGARDSGPVVTRFALWEGQSEQARPLGDHRPFVAAAATGDRTVVMFDLAHAHDVVAALAEALFDPPPEEAG